MSDDRPSDNATMPIDPAGERATNRLHAALRQHRADMVAALHETNRQVRKWRELDKGSEIPAKERIADLCGEAQGRAAVIDLFDVLLRGLGRVEPMSLCTKCQTNEASVNDNTGLCLSCLYPDRGRKGGLLLESFLLSDLPRNGSRRLTEMEH